MLRPVLTGQSELGENQLDSLNDFESIESDRTGVNNDQYLDIWVIVTLDISYMCPYWYVFVVKYENITYKLI